MWLFAIVLRDCAPLLSKLVVVHLLFIGFSERATLMQIRQAFGTVIGEIDQM